MKNWCLFRRGQQKINFRYFWSNIQTMIKECNIYIHHPDHFFFFLFLFLYWTDTSQSPKLCTGHRLIYECLGENKTKEIWSLGELERVEDVLLEFIYFSKRKWNEWLKLTLVWMVNEILQFYIIFCSLSQKCFLLYWSSIYKHRKKFLHDK